jgi:hypothetical protein
VIRRVNDYSTLKLDIKKAVLKEYRQMLYKKHTDERSFVFFLRTYFAYGYNSFALFLLESFYFIGRRLKK